MYSVISNNPGERTKEFATYEEAWEYANNELFDWWWDIRDEEEDE